LFGLAIATALGFVPTAWQLVGGALVLLGIGQLSARRWWASRRQVTPL
jgi:hypothetical protein